ncbi:MAG: hypothetical protein OHK0026_03500 [Rhodocyclaceae bacterium]
MRILELHTGLFPDERTVRAALACLEPQHPVARIDLSRPLAGDEAWDAVLAAILASDRIVTI